MSDRTQIDKLDQDWLTSFKQKDAKGCAACYTEDAWVISSYGDQSHGLSAIEKTMQEWIDGGAQNKHTSLLEFSMGNDIGYSIVAYSEDYENEDGSLDTETGKAVNVYKRQADGTWKFHVNALTSDAPSSA